MSAQQLVLIVNSDAKEQRVLTVSLKKAGLSVRGARDGFDALQILDEDRGEVGVVIIDLNLDRLDGFELCERIRDDGRFDGVALIALSSSKDLATRLRAYETGYDELLEKPVYIKDIATRVELLLERRAREVLIESEAEEVRGTIGQVSVVDLVQTIQSGKMTGYARILSDAASDENRPAHTESLHEDEDIGQIFFEQGKIIDAEVGRLRGESALYRMMRWTSGRYRLKTMDQVRRRPRIRRTANELVADGLERAERWGTIIGRMPRMDTVYEVDLAKLAGEVDAMPEEVRAMLRLFDGVRNLGRTIMESRIGDLEALRVVERLYQRNQLILVEPSPDAEAETDVRDGVVREWLGDGPGDATESVGLDAPDGLDAPWFSSEPTPAADTSDALVRQAHAEDERRRRDESARQTEERKRLQKERSRLQQEQSVVLAEIARSQAQTAREQEDQARRHVEARRRRERVSETTSKDEQPPASTPAALSTPAPLPTPRQERSGLSWSQNDQGAPAGPDAQAPEADAEREEGDAFTRSAQSIREQVVSALAEAELYRAKVAEPEPTWEDRVHAHTHDYQVISTAHVLKPMTLIPPDEEEKSDRNMFDMARLAVSDVFDSVEPEDSVDIDMGFDGSVKGPKTPAEPKRPSASEAIAAELAAQTLAKAAAEGRRQDKAALAPQPASSPVAATTAEATTAEDAAAEAAAAEEAARAAAVEAAKLAVASVRGAGHSAPEPGRTHPGTPAAKREEPKPAADVAKAIADTEPPEPDETPRQRQKRPDALATAEGADAPTPAEPEAQAERVSKDSLEHAFFADEAPPAQSKLGTIAALFIIVLIIGAIVFLINQGDSPVDDDEDTPDSGPSMSADGAERDGDPKQEDAVEGAAADEDPFVDVTEDLPTPHELRAQQDAESLSTWVAVHAMSIAEQLTGAPGDPDLGGTEGDPIEGEGIDPLELPKEDPPKEVAKVDPPKEDPKEVVKVDPPKEKPPKEDPPKEDPPKEKPPKEKPPKEKPPKDDVKISKTDDAAKLVSDGKNLFKKKKYDQAIKTLNKALDKKPGDTNANYYLGMSYLKSRQYPNAVKYLEKVRAARKGSARFWQDLGSAYIGMSKQKEGVDAYKKAVEILGPEDATAKKLQQYIDSR